MFRWSGGWAVVGILLAAAAYDLVLALRHSTGGDALFFGLVGTLVAGRVLFTHSPQRGLFAPAPGLYVVARFYTSDPYYWAPFHASADGGFVSPAWVLGLLGLAVAAGVTTHIWRRTFPVESAIVLVLLMLTAFFMGAD